MMLTSAVAVPVPPTHSTDHRALLIHAPSALLEFAVLDATVPEEREQWERWWSGAGRGEIFAHPAYLREIVQPGERPLCAVARFADGGTVLNAFVMRPITHDAGGAEVDAGYWDTYTALVYGGPLVVGGTGQDLERFWALLRSWAQENGVVSEVIRFSPVPGRRLSYPGVVRAQAPHVVRHLESTSEEQIVSLMRPNARRNLRRAITAGVSIEIDTTGDRLDDFLEIYRETMERVGADERFHFRRALFETIHRCFPGRFAYVYGMREQRAVSVDLMLYADGVSYYFLGGTRSSDLHSGAHVAVSVAAMRTSMEHGCMEHVLTGGVTNTLEDSLLEYKRRLAPDGLSEYCTGEQIYLDEVYGRLISSASEAQRASSYFPMYRTQTEPHARIHELAAQSARSPSGREEGNDA